MSKMKEFDEAVNSAINGEGTLTRILRYVLIFGWIAAAGLFGYLADEILTGQKVIQAEVKSICIEVGAIKEWRNNMNHEHDRLDRRLDRITDRINRGGIRE